MSNIVEFKTLEELLAETLTEAKYKIDGIDELSRPADYNPVLNINKKTKDIVLDEIRGKVVTVWSNKGGTGKTTIAVNTAIALAKELYKEKKRAILVDLNFYNPDIANALEVKKPECNIVELMDWHTLDDLEEFIVPYTKQANLHILRGKKLDMVLKSKGDESEEQFIIDLISKLTKKYDYVMIDTAHAIDATGTYVGLLLSDSLIFPISRDYCSLMSNSKEVMLLLGKFGITELNIIPVMNFDISNTVSQANVEKTTALKDFVSVPYVEEMSDIIVEGSTVIAAAQTKKAKKAKKAYEEIVERILDHK